jgi:hypothetical protein
MSEEEIMHWIAVGFLFAAGVMLFGVTIRVLPYLLGLIAIVAGIIFLYAYWDEVAPLFWVAVFCLAVFGIKRVGDLEGWWRRKA